MHQLGKIDNKNFAKEKIVHSCRKISKGVKNIRKHSALVLKKQHELYRLQPLHQESSEMY